uniref:Uncharacterized protein n=1 Tax=Populus alba TaxID=43335 RepID=A0A4U5QE13_POPAL|nr:hypothetical protein D5086_0000120890 [Populus alba]
MIKDEKPGEEQSQRVIKSSLLSGSSGSPDGSEQHVGVMNATFSTPCSLVSFVNHRPSISFAPVVAVQWRICSISAATQQQQCSRPEERGENTKNRRRNHRTGGN